MNKNIKPIKNSVISFRAADDTKKKIDREAKKRKQTRSDFVAAVFLAGLETVVAANANNK